MSDPHRHDDHRHDDHRHDHRHDDHRHDHGSGPHEDLTAFPRRRLTIALGLTASFLVVEVVAGLLSGSLALLSDAGHMLTDAGALGLALWAQRLGSRPRSDRKTFGYRRAEILAAAANGIVLGITAVAVIVEAVRRFAAPPHIHGVPMLVVAAVGLAINLVAAKVLSGGPGHDLNMRAAAAHVMADAAGSLAAIIAAALILIFGWTLADPVTSILISALILFGAWRLLRDAVNVLMEGAPAGFDVGALERIARETPGVRDVHDLHVWSIVGDVPVVTAHVVLVPGAHGVEVARAVCRRIEDKAGRAHVTVQPEATQPDGALLPADKLVR
jgi:cobalt-zinc-cadmium efflux system protein